MGVMGLTGRDSFCDFVKVGSSSSPKNKKKKSNFSERKKSELHRVRSTGNQNASIRLQIHELGPICKSRKKATAVLPESEEDEDEDEDDSEFAKQFGKEGWPDDDKCMWLSSGSTPSSCFDDFKFSYLVDLPLDEWLLSLLSVSANSVISLGKAITFFDGSRVNPIEEASLVLEIISDEERILQEDFKEEEVVTWLLSSIGNDLTDSSITCSERAESSWAQSCDDSTSCDNSSLFSTNLDSPSWILDSEGKEFGFSLVNLDREDSKWISDTESELDHFQSDFPSPSFRSSWDSKVPSSNSSISSLTEVNCDFSEATSLEDFNTDEPLFWPSDQKSDWGLEVTWDFFIMSPHKNKYKAGNPEVTSSKSFKLSLHDKEMDLKEGCKRRLVLSAGSTSSKILELKCRDSNKDVRRTNSMPSRLSKSTKISMKIVPLDMKDDIKEPIDKKVLTEKSAGKYRNFLDGNLESIEELPIEKLLGLDEFDGREGVESEFNKDNFSLDESL